MVIERKGGRTFSLRVLLRANFVFLFSKFSSVLSCLHAVPLCCSFSFPFFFLHSVVFSLSLLVTTVCFCMGDLDTKRMRFLEEQILKVVSSPGAGLF